MTLNESMLSSKNLSFDVERQIHGYLVVEQPCDAICSCLRGQNDGWNVVFRTSRSAPMPNTVPASPELDVRTTSGTPSVFPKLIEAVAEFFALAAA